MEVGRKDIKERAQEGEFVRVLAEVLNKAMLVVESKSCLLCYYSI